MSIRKNTWDLGGHYDLTNSGLNGYQEPGYLYSWGRNAFGELGLNDISYRSSPTQIPGSQWKFLYTSRINGHATKTDGTFWSWGQGFWGQLGININGPSAYRSSPIQLPGTQWNKVATGRSSVVASKTDGTLWSWGYNLVVGELGQNDKTNYSSPTQIPGTQWSGTISTSYDAFYATKPDGTLWSWGYNRFGQLGQNNTTYYSSPIQIPGTQWNKVDGGLSIVGATKTDGTLWVWGTNSHGQLGINDRTEYSSPTQVPGTQWSGIFILQQSSLVTKTDGTLWAWGRNDQGGLGQNDKINRSSPTQVPGTQWSGMGNDGNSGPRQLHVIMKKTDNTLWAWGYNAFGQLGLNNVPRYSSPTQIPGTQWNSVAVGNGQSFATKYAP
jgi:alpha-tubulin suppressor-like RCC1 family protein